MVTKGLDRPSFFPKSLAFGGDKSRRHHAGGQTPAPSSDSLGKTQRFLHNQASRNTDTRYFHVYRLQIIFIFIFIFISISIISIRDHKLLPCCWDCPLECSSLSGCPRKDSFHLEGYGHPSHPLPRSKVNLAVSRPMQLGAVLSQTLTLGHDIQSLGLNNLGPIPCRPICCLGYEGVPFHPFPFRRHCRMRPMSKQRSPAPFWRKGSWVWGKVLNLARHAGVGAAKQKESGAQHCWGFVWRWNAWYWNHPNSRLILGGASQSCVGLHTPSDDQRFRFWLSFIKLWQFCASGKDSSRDPERYIEHIGYPWISHANSIFSAY